MKQCDVLIVGAGFAGMVMAERLTNVLGKRCILVDKRFHLGGNAYDYVDHAGVLVHKYGAHLFHTNADSVLHYLSKFTEWRPAAYTASSYTDGKLWSFPVNLLTFEQMLGRSSSTAEMDDYLATHRTYYGSAPRNAEEAVTAQVGWDLYEKFYKGYTLKQWGRHPRELDASVCSRVPIRTTRDARYFNDRHQYMPKAGYSAMFDRMLAACTGIELWLGMDYRDIVKRCQYKHLVYTGPIDEFFDYIYGPLPYRSLRFEHESYCAAQMYGREFWQPTTQVAYPNSEEYTRIIEIKHATGQWCRNTTIVKEYPEEWAVGKEPYYPVPSPGAAEQYAKYKALADCLPYVTFVGRLATYRYLNMDQVVASSLAEFEKLRRVL